MADNIRVVPSAVLTDPLVATRTLTVNGTAGVEVAYGLVGYEAAGALVAVDATHGLPTDPLDRPARLLGHVTVDNAAVAVTGTFWPATQPVSADSLPLPAGAAVAARQPAFGTAGAAAVDVLTVQGAAAMTALLVDGSGVTQPVSIAAPVAVTGTFWQAIQPVSGTFWQATQPVSGTVTANQGGTWSVTVGAALPAGAATIGAVNLAQYVPAAGRLPVDGSGVTQPVSVAAPVAVTGTFWQATQPVSIAAAVTTTATLGPGASVVGVAIAPQQTGALYSGTTALVPKFAVVAVSAAGSTNIVAAVATKKLRVLRYALHSNGAVTAKFVSNGGTPTDLTGLKYSPGVGPFGGGAYCPLGLFETAAGEPLALNLSATVAVGGELTYIEV